MPTYVSVLLCLHLVFLSFHQKFCLNSLQLESLITAEHETYKMEAAKTDVLMN